MAEYALSYDAYAASPHSEQLLAFVKENRHIDQWSQPYQGLYLLKSKSELLAINESFRAFFGNKIPHFITPISAASSVGILPEQIWIWLRTDHETMYALLRSYGRGETSGS